LEGGETERTHLGGSMRWRTVLGVHAKGRVVCVCMLMVGGCDEEGVGG